MSLDKLSKQLQQNNNSNQAKLPPIELWHPPFCGEIDLQIKANGDWYYGGTVFKRLALVKLFASVLWREQDEQRDEYFLVTPVEKVKITVEDAPFIITQWRWLDDKQTIMEVSTNLADTFVLDASRHLTIDEQGNLYINVRRNLFAKVHRNVYYQWVDLAAEQSANQEKQSTEPVALYFYSDGQKFILGHY